MTPSSRTHVLYSLILVSVFWFGFQANNVSGMSRAEIRSMPLLERPNRPGHFYGNNVRRVHHFRHGR